jgi:hypothetical protein
VQWNKKARRSVINADGKIISLSVELSVPVQQNPWELGMG